MFFLKDYELDQDIKLSFHYFKLTFQCMSHLSISGLFRMVFEHLWDCFHLEDLASGFPKLFQLCFHSVKSHIPLQITHVFGITCLLAMTKLLGRVRFIIVGESLY